MDMDELMAKSKAGEVRPWLGVLDGRGIHPNLLATGETARFMDGPTAR